MISHNHYAPLVVVFGKSAVCLRYTFINRVSPLIPAVNTKIGRIPAFKRKSAFVFILKVCYNTNMIAYILLQSLLYSWQDIQLRKPVHIEWQFSLHLHWKLKYQPKADKSPNAKTAFFLFLSQRPPVL